MEKFLLYVLKYVPRRMITELIGWISKIENEYLQRRLINWFVKKYKVNTDEMLYSVEHYRTLYQFFIRELKPSVRTIDSKIIVAPVDGILTECGNISNNRFECKGEMLSIKDLVACENFLGDIQEGYFTVHYLSPSDYHWIHSPVDGEIYKVSHIRGDLYPVFDDMIAHKKDILCINERYNVFIKNDRLKICVCMIAAMGVGNIVPSNKIIQYNTVNGEVDLNKRPIEISKGEKLAYFAIGSTVVLIFNNFEPDYGLKGKHLKFGHGITYL
ncbi:MAG: archaetidylserine decarboxylase [Deltaproteobacteria bacterium]|nr:archaetidylserine decarboxylase [Deltaproteobacteria bacterium]